MKKTKKIIEIWSSYPPPYGGVSIHSMRLYNILKYKYNLVFKNFNGILDCPEDGIYKVQNQLKEILSYLLRRNKIIHLHSNRLLVWLIMFFYVKSNRLLLTLHSQNLKKNLPFIKDLVVKMFFRKVDFIIISNQTFADYLILKYKLNRDKVVVIPSFIFPLEQESKDLPKEITSFFNKYNKIVSSFAWKLYCVDNKDVYGIDHIIKAFSLVKKSYKSVGLILVIPIIDDKNYFDSILKKIEQYNLSESILIYNKGIRNGFNIWGKSDVFLRSTTTDIEGISVKEALMLNTSVIATDVVERPKGVDLYTYGDIEILSELILNKLRFGTPETFKDDISTGIDKIDKIYNILIN